MQSNHTKPSPLADVNEILRIELIDGLWHIERGADIETLWEAMDEDALDADERIPYWVEIWPSAIALGNWLLRHKGVLHGKRCLDIGCGLGLTALAATRAGAKVVGFDYAREALGFAQKNATRNQQPQPCWLQMDWRQPAFQRGSFQFIWGADILYERRFALPICALFDLCLAPKGEIWLAQPRRGVSTEIRDFLQSQNWQITELETASIKWPQQACTVELWKITRHSSLHQAEENA